MIIVSMKTMILTKTNTAMNNVSMKHQSKKHDHDDNNHNDDDNYTNQDNIVDYITHNNQHDHIMSAGKILMLHFFDCALKHRQSDSHLRVNNSIKNQYFNIIMDQTGIKPSDEYFIFVSFY